MLFHLEAELTIRIIPAFTSLREVPQMTQACATLERSQGGKNMTGLFKGIFRNNKKINL